MSGISQLDQIDDLSAKLEALVSRLGVTGPELVSLVEDPAARFVVERVIWGGALPHNPATATALRLAVASLEAASA